MIQERLQKTRQERLEGVERVQDGRRLLFIPGVTTSSVRVKGLADAFSAEYGGADKVLVMNSVASRDKNDNSRWGKMAEFIMKSKEDGIDIVAHSLGAAELYKVIREIEKRDKNWFAHQADKDKFHFVLDAPSGFNKGAKQKVQYFRNTIVGLTREHGIERWPISRRRNVLRGLDSLIAYPPPDFTPDELKNLVVGVRKILPERSTPEERAGLERIGFEPQEKRNQHYVDKLSPFDQRKVADCDQAIKHALTKNDLKRVKMLMRNRGELLRDVVEDIYNSGSQDTGRRRWGGYEGFKMFFTAMGRRPMGKFKKLADMGYTIDFVLPEHDIAVPLKHLLQFFDSKDKAQKYIKIPEFFTHPSLALQPESTTRIIRNLKAHSKSEYGLAA